jgi:SAM-dependent methyltransferase
MSATTLPGFDKYELSGAYHWSKLDGRGVRSYHARLWARYGWFVDRLSAVRPALTLDVGCGDAALTHLLSLAGDGRVVGVEPDAVGVRLGAQALGQAGSRATVVPGSAYELPFESAVADVVVMCELLEHLQDVNGALKEAARVLRLGGTLLISTPRRRARPADKRHIHEFDPTELREVCRRHFHDVDVLVAEPALLVRLYGSRAGRAAVNTVARRGLNPFELVLGRERGTSRFCQLYAVASGPVRT